MRKLQGLEYCSEFLHYKWFVNSGVIRNLSGGGGLASIAHPDYASVWHNNSAILKPTEYLINQLNFIQVLKNIEERSAWNISWRDPPCKDGNARFTTVPLNALSDQVCISCIVFVFLNCFAVSLRTKKQCKKSQKYTLFESEKRRYIPCFGQIKVSMEL